MRFKITFVLILAAVTLYSQSRIVDSFRLVIVRSKSDTARIRNAIALGDWYFKSNPDSALFYHHHALQLAEKLSDPIRKLKTAEANLKLGQDYYRMSNYDTAMALYKKTIATCNDLIQNNPSAEKDKAIRNKGNALGNIGGIYFQLGDFSESLRYYFLAIREYETIKNEPGLAVTYGNIGLIHSEQAHYSKALDYFFRALKIDEKLGNKYGQPRHLSAIGVVFFKQGDYGKAIMYQLRALKLEQETGNKYGAATALSNLGVVKLKLGEYNEALKNFNSALELNHQISDKRSAIVNINNIGSVYTDYLSNYPLARSYYQKALTIAEELGIKPDIALAHGNIGRTYFDERNYAMAEPYLKQSAETNKELGLIDVLVEDYFALSSLYEKTGRYKEALHYYKEYISARDSVMSEENQKASIQKEMQFEFQKKATADSVKVAEEKKVVAAQLKQEKTQRFALYGGLGLVGIFAIFMVNRFRVTNKQKKLIEAQKLIVEEQKHIVEEKQKEILDSIRYARRIQRALITNEYYISQHISRLKN